MMENAGMGVTPPLGVDWATIQQQLASECDCLFCMMAEQQRATIDQVLAKQAVDTLFSHDLSDSKKVREAILETLNLSPKAYRRHL